MTQRNKHFKDVVCNPLDAFFIFQHQFTCGFVYNISGVIGFSIIFRISRILHEKQLARLFHD